jgi:hypothetical protein
MCERPALLHFLLIAGSLASLSCGSTPSSAPPPPTSQTTNTFSLTSPEFTLRAGEEKTFCYYTKLSNERAFGARKFTSSMTPGSHHLILYMTSEATRPEGTFEACGIFPGTRGGRNPAAIPVWAYAAQTPEGSLEMPEGVGMLVRDRQPVILQMHYLNARPEALQARVTLQIEAHTTDDYVRAAPFVTYDTSIRIEPHSTATVRGSCVAPQGGKFFLASTHSHKFTTRARMLDGNEIVVDTTDWDHPKVEKFVAPYRSFQSGRVGYECQYKNDTDNVVLNGDSAQTDEMCMAVGYFFPATGMRFCIDGFVLPF